MIFIASKYSRHRSSWSTTRLASTTSFRYSSGRYRPMPAVVSVIIKSMCGSVQPQLIRSKCDVSSAVPSRASRLPGSIVSSLTSKPIWLSWFWITWATFSCVVAFHVHSVTCSGCPPFWRTEPPDGRIHPASSRSWAARWGS